jgi:hypothetical protein
MTTSVLPSPPDHGRIWRINLVVWLVIVFGAAVQTAVLHRLSGSTRPLGLVLVWKLALLPLWALATPAILRAAVRWPLRGPGTHLNLLRHLCLAAGFIAGTNILLRLPVLLGSPDLEGYGFLGDLERGLSFFGPLALIAWAAIVALGQTLIPAPGPATPAAPSADALPIREAEGLRVVPLGDIELIEADDNYVRVRASGGAYRTRERLADLESRLDPTRFVRVHRSVIVPIRRIRAVRPVPHGDWVLQLDDGSEVRVARGRRLALQQALGTGRPSGLS